MHSRSRRLLVSLLCGATVASACATIQAYNVADRSVHTIFTNSAYWWTLYSRITLHPDDMTDSIAHDLHAFFVSSAVSMLLAVLSLCTVLAYAWPTWPPRTRLRFKLAALVVVAILGASGTSMAMIHAMSESAEAVDNYSHDGAIRELVAAQRVARVLVADRVEIEVTTAHLVRDLPPEPVVQGARQLLLSQCRPWRLNPHLFDLCVGAILKRCDEILSLHEAVDSDKLVDLVYDLATNVSTLHYALVPETLPRLSQTDIAYCKTISTWVAGPYDILFPGEFGPTECHTGPTSPQDAALRASERQTVTEGCHALDELHVITAYRHLSRLHEPVATNCGELGVAITTDLRFAAACAFITLVSLCLAALLLSRPVKPA